MARRYRRRKDPSWMIYVAIAAIVAVATWHYWPDEMADPNGGPGPGPEPNGSAGTMPSRDNVIRVAPTVVSVGPTTRPGAKSTPEALKKFKAGNAAFEAQKELEARGLLSEAVFSGGLSEKAADEARSKLSYLAAATIFSQDVNPQDPYTMKYRFKSGELAATIERQKRLHVPTQLLVKVNRLPSAAKFQAGLDYKLIKGPFHAIVYKSIFKMDLYLHRKTDNLPPVFIKRYDVGLGRNNSTPIGKWRLGCGSLTDASGKRERGKLLKAPWNPPPNSPQRLQIEYNKPGYPFGRKGMWISLVGLDENTKKLTDYGIHSTDNQSSIGQQSSMGCVRMRDADIQEIYDRLYEFWSTVRIAP